MWTLLTLYLYLQTFLILTVTTSHLSFDPIQDTTTVYNFRPPSQFEKIRADDGQKDKKYGGAYPRQNWPIGRGGRASNPAATNGYEHAAAVPIQILRHTPNPPIWSEPADRNRPYFGHPGNNDILGMEREGREKAFHNGGGHHKNKAGVWPKPPENGATNPWTGHHHQPTPKPKPKHQQQDILRIKPMASAQTPPNGKGPPIGPWSPTAGSSKNDEKVTTTLWNVAPHGGYVLTEEILKPHFRTGHPGSTWATPVTHTQRWHDKRHGFPWTPPTVARPRSSPGSSEVEQLEDTDDDEMMDGENEGSDMAWGLLGQRDKKPNGTWRKEDPLTSKRVMNGGEPKFENLHE